MLIEEYWHRDKSGTWREAPDYDADYVKVGFYNSAYSGDPLMGEVAYHLGDKGLGSWDGSGGRAYPPAIADEVLKVISHPSNRKYLLNLVEEITKTVEVTG